MEVLRAGGVEARALNLWKYLECCPKSLKDMGRVLCSEIAAQDKHPWLCGYSLGGRLAMQAVLAHPPLWKGAVFVSANPGMEDETGKSGPAREGRRMGRQVPLRAMGGFFEGMGRAGRI